MQFIVEILHLHSTVWRCNCEIMSVMFFDKLNVLNQRFVCMSLSVHHLSFGSSAIVYSKWAIVPETLR